MNRSIALAVGAAGGYGIAVFAAMAVFFSESSVSTGVAVGFGLVTTLAVFGVTRLVAP